MKRQCLHQLRNLGDGVFAWGGGHALQEGVVDGGVADDLLGGGVFRQVAGAAVDQIHVALVCRTALAFAQCRDGLHLDVLDVVVGLGLLGLAGIAVVAQGALDLFLVDAGVTASDNLDGDITDQVTVVNPVDVTKLGEYTLTYNLTDDTGNQAAEVTRKVTVVDTTGPVITLTGDAEVTVEAGDTYEDAGATVADNIDSVLEATSVSTVDTTKPGEYAVTYNVADSNGNDAVQVSRKVTVVDTTAPVITLNGEAEINVEAAGTYSDAGATSTDIVDGDLTETIVTNNPVDTSKPGEYTVTYESTDAAGNKATLTRKVTVGDSAAPVITITGDNTSNISLTGSVADLRAAIRTLNYLSPDGYFGDDGLNVSSTVNDAVFSKRTDVTVEPNCGNQTDGTATRFDIGYFDNTTTTFTTNSYVTSVSEWDNSEPIYYYGFCRGSQKRFDYASQQKLTGSSASCTGDYRHASTRLQGDHSDHDALSVFLYEEADEASRDRFSLFFIFDQYNNDCDDDLAGYNAQSTDAQKLNWARTEGSGIMGQLATSLGHERANVGQKRCHAKFRLNNIEPTRNLDDENDLHTFTDDPGEYAPAIIGTDGTMVGNVKWNGAHDGLVVPLRLPSTAQLNSDNQTELKDYDQGDPIFELLMRDNINRWRVRTLNVAKTDVEFRNFTIDDDGGTKVPAIKLNITKSQRCPK